MRAILYRLCLLGLLILGTVSAWYLDPASHAAAQAMTEPDSAPEGDLPRDCGVERLFYGKGHAPAPRECLWDAYQQGIPVRFESRATLVGSTIIYQIDVAPGRVAYTVDQMQSLYGPRQVSTYICTGMARREVDGHLYFTLQGCPTIRILGF